MNFMFSGVFWGAFLIVIGLSIILKVTLNINIPVVRIFFALFFVYLGISVITGGFGMKNNVIFNEVKIKNASDNGEYNVIFGKGEIDLTNVDISEKTVKIKINTVFGASEIMIKSSTPVIIQSNAVFSGVQQPDGGILSFGNNTYKTPSSTDSSYHLQIELNAVFSGVDIKLKN